MGEGHSGAIRVLILHDVRVLREGLASLLREQLDMAVEDAPCRGDIPSQQGEHTPVDVVLLGTSGGTEPTSYRMNQINSALPDAKVIVIGVPEIVEEILGYIEAGASGYTLSESSPEDLIRTIQQVHRGEASCAPNILANLFERVASLKKQVQSTGESDLHRLTRRELEVLQLVTEGMSNKEIAAHLTLELQSVKNYVHSILEKLRVHSRREAALHRYRLTAPEKAFQQVSPEVRDKGLVWTR